MNYPVQSAVSTVLRFSWGLLNHHYTQSIHLLGHLLYIKFYEHNIKLGKWLVFTPIVRLFLTRNIRTLRSGLLSLWQKTMCSVYKETCKEKYRKLCLHYLHYLQTLTIVTKEVKKYTGASIVRMYKKLQRCKNWKKKSYL